MQILYRLVRENRGATEENSESPGGLTWFD